ncbi:MAG: ABC transporter permease [Gammaproteobacteria bacterium]|nr:MAG: ABC transporter permease [Gammaproteobacteria bacterium]
MSLSMPPLTPTWRIKAWAFACEHKLFVIGLLLLLLIILAALFAPWVAPYDPNKIAFSQKLLPPSAEHWMGTDKFGRDIFSRVLYGARTSLIIGGAVTLTAMLIGIPVGLISGYFGGRVDTVLMRLSDVFLAFPPLLLPIAITAALGSGLANAMIALAVSWFPWYARIMRGAVLRIRSESFIAAARAMGVSHGRILQRHVLPNATTPVIVQGSMDFGYTILAAASLSFIGLGAKPPMIEWGLMAASSRSQFLENPWTVLFPGLAIFVLVMAVNLVGDGLRDVLDPKKGTR